MKRAQTHRVGFGVSGERRLPLRLLLKQIIECGACVRGVSRRSIRFRIAELRGRQWQNISRHGDSRREPFALVRLILDGDPDRYGFQALKPGRRLKMRALLAAMQCHSALGAIAHEVDGLGKSRRAIEATRSDHILHKSREFGPRHIKRQFRALWAMMLRSVGPEGTRLSPVGIHVAVLPVFAISVHCR